MPSLSSRDANLLGDVVDEAGRVRAFLGRLDADGLAHEEKTLYAVKAAIQNVTEACVQLDAGRRGTRFAELFPQHDLGPIRRMGNLLRHDYGAVNAGVLFNDATIVVPAIARRA